MKIADLDPKEHVSLGLCTVPDPKLIPYSRRTFRTISDALKHASAHNDDYDRQGE